jgi:anaerobic selenocysteine-containing dehydrogenase
MSGNVIPTTCPMDCPDTCALDVTVRDGRIERIAAGHDHPVTAGFICTKVARFAQRVYHPERLTTPLRRVGPKGAGEFEPIDWEEAIAEITDRFRGIKQKSGGEAILPYHYGGSNGYMSDGLLDHLFFARLGASRLARTLCAGPTTAVATGMYGKMPGVAFEDFVHAKCIVIWGANPKASNIHLIPFLREAKQRGAFVAVVDPVRNLTAREADLHLPVLPGTDLPVALSMIRLWREWECLDEAFLAEHAVGLEGLVEAAEAWPVERAAAEAGVPAAHIERLARVYADAAPALIRCGWGLERNSNGGHAVAAILAMPALLGKFGTRGGGYTLSNSGAGKFDRDALLGPVEWTTREINMAPLGEVLTSPLVPPVEALFVYNCNPVATVPDQHAVLRGLEREDLFTVVFDQIVTDTVPYADVVLPATTFLEHYDLRMGYGSYVVGGVQPVVTPPGVAKSNHEVFALLGQAMGFEDEAFTWDDETALRRTAEALSVSVAQGGIARFDFPGETPVQFETVLPRTADGKIHLTPGELGSGPFVYRPPDATYPLALISPATSKTVSSTMGEYNLPRLYAELHPDDAAPRNIGDGDTVRVHNELGEVVCSARVRDRMRPGVVLIPKGAWRRASRSGFTSTALCPAHVNDVGGGACYNDARVEVELA